MCFQCTLGVLVTYHSFSWKNFNFVKLTFDAAQISSAILFLSLERFAIPPVGHKVVVPRSPLKIVEILPKKEPQYMVSHFFCGLGHLRGSHSSLLH